MVNVRPGGIVEVEVRAIGAGGAGIAELPDGRVVFVHRTAPGDRARVRVTTLRKRWARASLVEVLEPGPARRPPPCPHYARCGGCTVEHLEYPEQLRWKGRIIADALARIGGVEASPPVVEPSPCQIRYRNRVTFTLIRLRGDRVVAGFREIDRPDRVADTTGACLLPEEEIARAWDGLRAQWGAGADRLPAADSLRLTLRAAAAGVVLVVEGGSGPWAPELLFEAVPELVAIWHREPGGVASLVAGDAGADASWMGERVRPGAGAFLQVNRGAAELLHAAVLAAVGPPLGRSVIDGYCGVGMYGRALARSGARVTGIELDAEAVLAARDEAPEGFAVIEGPVEDRLGEALPADVAILNPPRAGLHEAVPAQLSDSGVERLVYVSCDPATLARDLGRLEGYRLVSVHAFDLFPQTAHVETLTVLARR